jgi:N-acyl-D-amino-acid deacylase
MPPWASEGGLEALIARLENPATRARIVDEMQKPTQTWENMLQAAGADGILLTGFDNPALKPLQGKTLAQVATMRGRSAAETAADLIVEDRGRIDAIYFLMSEDNVRRTLALPWVSFGSDAAAVAPEGDVLDSPTHPRAYGTFARVLGKYVRDEGVITLSDAIRKLSAQPAAILSIADRGRLVEGYFADVVVFDPATIRDHATFESPHQLATGMEQVFVNGVQVLKDGAHTGATPGRVVRGPGHKWNLERE